MLYRVFRYIVQITRQLTHGVSSQR